MRSVRFGDDRRNRIVLTIRTYIQNDAGFHPLHLYRACVTQQAYDVDARRESCKVQYLPRLLRSSGSERCLLVELAQNLIAAHVRDLQEGTVNTGVPISGKFCRIGRRTKDRD